MFTKPSTIMNNTALPTHIGGMTKDNNGSSVRLGYATASTSANTTTDTSPSASSAGAASYSNTSTHATLLQDPHQHEFCTSIYGMIETLNRKTEIAAMAKDVKDPKDSCLSFASFGGDDDDDDDIMLIDPDLSDEFVTDEEKTTKKVLDMFEERLHQVSNMIQMNLQERERQVKDLLNRAERAHKETNSEDGILDLDASASEQKPPLDLDGSIGNIISMFEANIKQGLEDDTKNYKELMDPVVLREIVDGYRNEFTNLQRYMVQTSGTFLSLAGYIDAQLYGTTRMDNVATLMVHQTCLGSGGGKNLTEHPIHSSIVLVLNDLYELVRQGDERKEMLANPGENKKWVAPSSFERTTSKYWIQDNMLPTVLSTVVQEAPLLVYGKDSSNLITTVEERQNITKVSDTDVLWDELSSAISSVYFDNIDNMCMYKERIKRSEGAQLFRVRWYGKHKPTGNAHVFLELKTHHEKWINTKSIKERVTIQEHDMNLFLQHDKEPWDVETVAARDIVLRGASRNKKPLEGEHLEKQVELICTMHNLVVAKNLKPCVRSQYQRVAFQSSKSNKLRLTIDRNVAVIDETAKTSSEIDCWCLNDREAEDPSRIKVVPYSIFEVKLSDFDMPHSIQAMLDDVDVIQDAYKFSKFLTGAAAFQQATITTLPYWAEHPRFISIFDGGKGEEIDDSMSTANVSTPSFFANKADTKKKHEDLEAPKNGRRLSDGSITFSDLATGDEDEDAKPKGVKKPAKSVRRRFVTLSSFDANSTHSRLSMGTNSVDRSTDGSLGMASLVSGKNRNGGKKKKLAPRKAVRVEPKSYFANERTFIQWISAALLLVTIAAIIMENSGQHKHAVTMGFSLMTCAAFVVVYAMFVYFRRLQLLSSGQPYGYVDKNGPLVLAIAVLAGLGGLLYHFVPITFNLPGTVTSNVGIVGRNMVAGEKCYQHPLGNFNEFFFEPSGVWVDEERQLLLVPSSYEIFGIPMEKNSTRKMELVSDLYYDMDLEAITYFEDKIFALWEGTERSQFVELEWVDGILKEVKRWWIKGTSAEGLAYIDGQLWVGYNKDHEEGSEDSNGGIHVYDVPDRSNNSTTIINYLEKNRKVNKKRLAVGLEDGADTKIGELVFFENRLYLLHDNIGLIRIWDHKAGKLLDQIRLPVIEGNGKQWEGFSLERRRNKKPVVETTKVTIALRSGVPPSIVEGVEEESSTLYMHLASDTPPQVWTIEVTEDANGHIIYPDCAGV